MTRVILVRHGETEHNRQNLTLGRADVPLNDLGRRQARAVAASFGRPPAAIYSSPLLRARSTAHAIALGTGCAVIDDAALIEMDVGEMEHLQSAELRAKYPEFLKAWLSEDVADARMPGGETLREVQERAWNAIEQMAAAHGDDEIVAVAHNFVIVTVVCHAIGLPLSEFRRIRHQVAAKTTIDLARSGSRLLALNDCSHLAAAGLSES